MVESLLRVERVLKRFGGLLAVDDVSLIVEAGRITALIGPNGAGKTTLFSIISGFLRPSEGRVFHRGADITGMPPHLLARRGIVRTFQIVQPFAGLTVHQNIAIGAHLSRRSRAGPPNPNSFCSTRCLPASTPPRLLQWCRSSAVSPTPTSQY